MGASKGYTMIAEGVRVLFGPYEYFLNCGK
jgi:hypothetical protein